MNSNTYTKPRSWVDTQISTRPKKRKAVIISENPELAIEIMNKKYGASRFPIGYLPFRE